MITVVIETFYILNFEKMFFPLKPNVTSNSKNQYKKRKTLLESK